MPAYRYPVAGSAINEKMYAWLMPLFDSVNCEYNDVVKRIPQTIVRRIFFILSIVSELDEKLKMCLTIKLNQTVDFY